MPTEIAKAYVQIIPSAEGITNNLTALMDKEAATAGKTAGKTAGGFFSSALSTAVTAGSAAVAASTAAVGKVFNDSLVEYAAYEQLAGGVETLFGDSADIVQKYASQAYQTAGMSANKYMETVTGFSASLLQSLNGDTKEAASIADMAIADMSDNANKMGSNIESIQNAYQGFAKQNYTMLDNLKLGYGGTKTEMERLLADASELSGVEYSIDSLSDVYNAVHVIQTELGITGTTAKEASETISGSAAAAGAAWQNVLTGLADENADTEKLIGDFAQSAMAYLDNMIPRMAQAAAGIGNFVAQAAPIIAEAIPPLVGTVLPSLIEGGIALVGGLLDGLIAAAPSLFTAAIEMVKTLLSGLSENAKEVYPTAVEIISTLLDGLTAPDTLSTLIDACIAIVIALVEGLIASLPRLLEAAPVIIENLLTALIEEIPKLYKAAWQAVDTLFRGLEAEAPALDEAALKLLEVIVTALVSGYTKLNEWGESVVDTIGAGIQKNIDSALTWGKDLIDNFINGIKSGFSALSRTVENAAQIIRDFIGFSVPKRGPLADFLSYPADMMSEYAEGIRNNSGLVASAVNDVAGIVSGSLNGDLQAGVIDINRRLSMAAPATNVGQDTAAGIINGLRSVSGTPLTIEFRLNDGTLAQVARVMLPGLINIANANGTPILNPS